MTKLAFHRSKPAFIPAEYDAIIPNGGGYCVGIFRNYDYRGKAKDNGDWHARILSKDLCHRLAVYEFSHMTKRELVSWLNRHQDDLRKATEKLDRLK